MPTDDQTENEKCRRTFRRHVEEFAKAASSDLDALDIGGTYLAIGLQVLSQTLGAEGAITYLRRLADKATLASQAPEGKVN